MILYSYILLISITVVFSVNSCLRHSRWLSVLMFAFALEYFCTSKVYNHLKAEETMYIQFCNAVSKEIQV